VVDLKLDDDQEIDLNGGDIGLHAPPMVAKNVVIVGAAHSDGSAPKSMRTPRATCAAST
jgi:quinoprotein glucose dehydrogenase